MGSDDGGLRRRPLDWLVRRDRSRRLDPLHRHVRSTERARPHRPRGSRAPEHGARRHPGHRRWTTTDRGGTRPMAHLLRARSRSHPARHLLPSPGRQDPGLRVPRRSSTHPSDPCPGGGPGRHGDGASPRPQCCSRRGDGPGPRLRPRSGRPCQRGCARPLRRRWLQPRRVGGRCLPRSAQPLRRDTRRDPQSLVVSTGTCHPRGRGGQLGRPHRLCLP